MEKFPPKPAAKYYVFSEQGEMRQLKGKPKENAKEKKERKKEFAENREKAFSIGDDPFSYFWVN